MTVFGFHASHEQIHRPRCWRRWSRAERPGSTPRCARTTSRRGASGRASPAFAWSWLGAALQATQAAVRRGQRARPALPPGDHRAGDRHPRRDVPGPVLGGAGHRRASNEHITGDALAAQGGPQRPAARVRRRHPGAAGRRGGQPRRPGHRGPGQAVDPAGGAAAADRRRRSASRPPRWCAAVGGRADHRERARASTCAR